VSHHTLGVNGHRALVSGFDPGVINYELATQKSDQGSSLRVYGRVQGLGLTFYIDLGQILKLSLQVGQSSLIGLSSAHIFLPKVYKY
jgi:hypothetical protein